MRFVVLLSLLPLLLTILSVTTYPQRVRPIRDDVGFCWEGAVMDRLIAYLEKEEKSSPERPGEKFPMPASVIGGISPHDDFLYAGRVYLPLYRALRAKEVVIFGVTHGGVRKEIGDPKSVVILDSFGKWKGPYGEVSVSPLREYVKDQLSASDVVVSDKAHELEHSIEATVPFLQYYNRGVAITPIMVTAMPLERMEELAGKVAHALARYIREKHLVLGKDIAILISSDANHYGRDFDNIVFGEGAAAHAKATAHDSTIAVNDLAGQLDSRKVGALARDLWGRTYAEQGDVVWCGKYSIPFGLLVLDKTAREVLNRGVTGTVLRYSDSYTEGVLPLKQTGMGTTAAASYKHWCGFVSVGYSAAPTAP